MVDDEIPQAPNKIKRAARRMPCPVWETMAIRMWHLRALQCVSRCKSMPKTQANEGLVLKPVTGRSALTNCSVSILRTNS